MKKLAVLALSVISLGAQADDTKQWGYTETNEPFVMGTHLDGSPLVKGNAFLEMRIVKDGHGYPMVTLQ
ncbi:hypothetical protein [Vibrio fortis]|uniref:hypothetical protein n=1 Tax=Vibrio fortis TaxID=212667 RepID=UPI003EB8148E